MALSSTRLSTAATCFFVAPFCILIPNAGGFFGLSLALVAWGVATRTTLWPAAVLLLQHGLITFAPPYDATILWLQAFGVAAGVTVVLSVCLGRIRPFAIFRLFQRGLRRLFSPLGTRGTIHARWFALGLWLAFLVIAAKPADYSQAGYLRGWLIAFLLMWTVRWFSPQWEPSALARVSLFVSPQPLLYYLSSPCFGSFHLSDHAPLVAASVSLATVWALHHRWTEWRLWNGRHPAWVLGERAGQRCLLRERVVSEGYRDSMQGGIVGSLPYSPSLVKEAKAALGFTLVFQVLNFSWLS
ncbi:MAG: hypothetical protein ACI9KE_000138 [Polyangiales bacterium]|jgi:hypothetical protein